MTADIKIEAVIQSLSQTARQWSRYGILF